MVGAKPFRHEPPSVVEVEWSATRRLIGSATAIVSVLDACLVCKWRETRAIPHLVLLDEPAGGVNLTMLADLKERLAAMNVEEGATSRAAPPLIGCRLAVAIRMRRRGPNLAERGIAAANDVLL